jgi:hypothetical protein
MHEFDLRAPESSLDFLVVVLITVSCITLQSRVSITMQEVDLADGCSSRMALAKAE